jgi:hypothetical protein
MEIPIMASVPQVALTMSRRVETTPFISHQTLVSRVGGGAINVKVCGFLRIMFRESVPQVERIHKLVADNMFCRRHPLLVKITGDGAINVRGCGIMEGLLMASVLHGRRVDQNRMYQRVVETTH